MKTPSPESVAFAARLRGALKERGLQQRWLARQIGASESQINWWLGCRCRPRPDRIADIARVIGVSANWLMTGVEGARALQRDCKLHLVGFAGGFGAPRRCGQ